MIDPERRSALTISVRAARLADSDAIGMLLKASYSRLLATSYDSDVLTLALPYLVKANHALLSSATYYAAEIEPSVLVGCGGWSAAMPGSGEIVEGEAHVRHVAIHPDYTRRGIAATLLARCISDARLFGITKLHCLSTLNAVPFYRALGFETIGPTDVSMGPSITFPGVLMRSDIA